METEIDRKRQRDRGTKVRRRTNQITCGVKKPMKIIWTDIKGMRLRGGKEGEEADDLFITAVVVVVTFCATKPQCAASCYGYAGPERELRGQRRRTGLHMTSHAQRGARRGRRLLTVDIQKRTHPKYTAAPGPFGYWLKIGSTKRVSGPLRCLCVEIYSNLCV